MLKYKFDDVTIHKVLVSGYPDNKVTIHFSPSPQKAKASAYKALVKPNLEYGCDVWNPYTVHDIDLLESV